MKPIHPFPARMAPEIALEQVRLLPVNSLWVDRMHGSGTALKAASDSGCRAIGYDLDPLARLMAGVWTRPIDTDLILTQAQILHDQAVALDADEIQLPWMDVDDETRDFVDFWFVEPQKTDLRRLSSVLYGVEHEAADALRLAMSRLIITKQRGASIAADVSHSRPHRVKSRNEFPVLPEFLRSAQKIARVLEEHPPVGNVQIREGDARDLPTLADGEADGELTSPPYLNAIDYMRGHRLSLVWQGYTLKDLRELRSTSIGAERQPNQQADLQAANALLEALALEEELPRREMNFLRRYALDMSAIVTEMYRVIRVGGRAVLVVGNSCLRNAFIRNTEIVKAAARAVGFELANEVERALPANRRYLPPPTDAEDGGTLDARMRTEAVLTFVRA